jgi:GTP cyclohydrolase III
MEKTPQDVLQQELLRERAQVLGRAGDSVERALTTLRSLETAIDERRWDLHRICEEKKTHGERELSTLKRQLIQDLNREISQYNRLREYAQLRYHYLIITREAIGLRKHQRVEEVYPIPPKKRHLQEL